MIAGLDEAGRGSFIGRVYSACVIVDDNFENKIQNDKIVIRDSKKMSLMQRNKARKYIEENAIAYSVEFSEQDEIENTNILNASIMAMHKCLDTLSIEPNKIFIDGNYFIKYKNIPHECIIKGDSEHISISCASILAKTYRDEYIENLCKENEILQKYEISKNKGYGTKSHLEAIKRYGITKFHRKTFGICKSF